MKKIYGKGLLFCMRFHNIIKHNNFFKKIVMLEKSFSKTMEGAHAMEDFQLTRT
ncbi:hypothetical protein [Peribacillus simplex]|uniref:hypothetical protein n=1 Tax=Peribacillus simplex TaxID=1478 RepID=UPI000AFFBC88|nr:hypothetical protein [Peribacillus simplex]